MLIPLAEAERRIDRARFRRLRVLSLPPTRSLGRRAGALLRAPASLPRVALSAMDGYAVRVVGRGSEGPYRIRGASFPSELRPRRTLGSGEAMYVTTGAPLPPGANAVVRTEATRHSADRLVTAHVPAPGEDILAPGESIRRGDVVLEPGQLIRPVDLGILLALGVRTVPVLRLRATVLPVGDERVPPGPPAARGTPEYLGPLVAGLLPGCATELLPPLPDDPIRVARALGRAQRSADLLVTIGGSSVGRKDVTKAALAARGRLLFEGVTVNVLKRGAVGILSETPVLVLPGQLVSAVTVFHQHGLHLLSRLVGRDLRQREEVVLREDVAVDHRMDSVYLFRRSDGGAAPLPWGVARMTGLLRAESFGVLAHGRRYRAGERLRVQRLWSSR